MTHVLVGMLKKHQKALVGVAVITLVVLLVVGGSIYNLVHNQREKHRLLKKQARLEEEYSRLVVVKEKLENGDLALLEQIARTQYHLAKPGEIEFRFTDK